MMTIRTWEEVDYDILAFIWECPHCHVQVARDGYEVWRTRRATCPVCKAEIKIIKSISTNRIDTDPKYTSPNLTDIEISKSYTKQELLLDIDLVLEGFRDRLEKEVEIMKNSASIIPDTFASFSLHLEDIDSVLDRMEKAGRRYTNALEELKKEVKALKVYQGAPII